MFLFLIFLLVLSICCFLLAFADFDRDGVEWFFIILGASVMTISIFGIYTIGEKDGQIDALTGHKKYELVKHKDSTSTWELIQTRDE